jgi:cathepsin X
MKSITVLLLISVVLVLGTGNKTHHHKKGARISPYPPGFNKDRPERLKQALKNKEKYPGCCVPPVRARRLSELPPAFDWCNVDGQNYCAPSWNQHQPKYCGACWVHGTLSAVNDRIKIQRGGQGIDVMLARQVMLNCGRKFGYGDGCNGGESVDVFEFMRVLGLPDESCNNYLAESSGCPESGEGFCRNCMMFDEDVSNYKCWAVDNYVKFHIEDYGNVHGEEGIMSEVMARGPITCGMVCPDEFVYGYDQGIFRYHGNETDMDHDVEIVGWGEEDGVKYWKVRNSWGSYWGENGFFRVVRGENNLRIEESCMFAIPESREEDKVLEGRLAGSMFGNRPVKHGVPAREAFPEAYKAPKPSDATAQPGEEAVAISHEHLTTTTTGIVIPVLAGALAIVMGVALFFWARTRNTSEYEAIYENES